MGFMSAKDFGKFILTKTQASANNTFSRENMSDSNQAFNNDMNNIFSAEHMDQFGDWSQTQSQLMGENIADAKDQIKKSSAAINEQMDGMMLPLLIIGGLLAAAVVYDKLK